MRSKELMPKRKKGGNPKKDGGLRSSAARSRNITLGGKFNTHQNLGQCRPRWKFPTISKKKGTCLGKGGKSYVFGQKKRGILKRPSVGTPCFRMSSRFGRVYDMEFSLGGRTSMAGRDTPGGRKKPILRGKVSIKPLLRRKDSSLSPEEDSKRRRIGYVRTRRTVRRCAGEERNGNDKRKAP